MYALPKSTHILVKILPRKQKKNYKQTYLPSCHWLPCLRLYEIATHYSHSKKWLHQNLCNSFLNRKVHIWVHISLVPRPNCLMITKMTKEMNGRTDKRTRKIGLVTIAGVQEVSHFLQNTNRRPWTENRKLTCYPQYAFHGLWFTLYSLDFARSPKTRVVVLMR